LIGTDALREDPTALCEPADLFNRLSKRRSRGREA
jgi:hypothetical protein